MSRLLAAFAVLGLCLSFTARAMAEDASQTDRDFVRKAALGGLMEVELGKYAGDHAANNDVKNFGWKMDTDHTKINERLKTLATTLGITIPDKLESDQAKHVEHLKKLEGTKFDDAYIRTMIRDHRKDVREFENAAQHVENADLKSFASDTLPTLQQHLQLAEETAAKIGINVPPENGKKHKK